MELLPIQLAVHVGIGEENLGGAAFLDDIQNPGLSQLIERLRRKHHRRVLFAPGLKGLNDVVLHGGVAEEYPRFVNEECLEHVGELPVRDDLVGPVQDVKEQRFHNLRVLAHALEVEALEPGKSQGVLGVVEEEPELPAFGPLLEAGGKAAFQGIGERAEGPEVGVNLEQVLDLVVEVLFLLCREPGFPVRLRQHLDEEAEKIQVRLRRGKRKGIDLEIG